MRPRRRVQALGPDEGGWRDAVTEDGVEQEAPPVELDDARRVAVPRDREVSRLVRVARRHERHGAPGPAAAELAHHRRRAGCPGPRPPTSRRRGSARGTGTRRRGSSASRRRAGASPSGVAPIRRRMGSCTGSSWWARGGHGGGRPPFSSATGWAPEFPSRRYAARRPGAAAELSPGPPGPSTPPTTARSRPATASASPVVRSTRSPTRGKATGTSASAAARRIRRIGSAHQCIDRLKVAQWTGTRSDSRAAVSHRARRRRCARPPRGCRRGCRCAGRPR